MFNPSTHSSPYRIKIYSVRNRILVSLGILISFLAGIFLIASLVHLTAVNRPAHPGSAKLLFLIFLLFAAILLFHFSRIPSVVITDTEIRVGWMLGGKEGVAYRHRIPWEMITEVESGGSRMIQWSPNTHIIYHSGRVPVGRSSDLKQAIISTRLGFNNYRKVLNEVITKAPQARIDQLTFDLIKR